MTAKKENNKSFTLTVVLMVSLILALLLPTTIAWFTDSATGTSDSKIQFGKVVIDVDEAQTVFTATASVTNMLPGDTLEFETVLSNAQSTVDVYAGIGTYIKFIHTKAGASNDITSLLQPYMTVAPLTIGAADLVAGTDGLVQLAQGASVTLDGSIEFSTALPNAIGENGEYLLNGQKTDGSTISLELHVLAGAIQKDNLTDVATAESEIKKLIYGANIGVAGATVNDISLESFTYLKSYIDTNHTDAVVLATADVTSNQTTLTIDVSDLDVVAGDSITVLHYNETAKQWETVGTYTVSDALTITADFTSLSPIALIKAVNYTLSGSGVGATLTADDKMIECDAAWDISATENDNVIAYVKDRTLTLVGKGNMLNYTSSSTAPWCTSFSNINSVEVKYGVTNIGEFLLYGCRDLVSVKLSCSVKSIGASAFYGYSTLTNITIPTGVTTIGNTAFYYCSELKSINLPDSITTIGDRAFHLCDSLTSLIIPRKVNSIGGRAFSSCSNLASIFMEHSSENEITSLNSNWLTSCSATVYYYSETEKAGYWHYVDGVPTLW